MHVTVVDLTCFDLVFELDVIGLLNNGFDIKISSAVAFFMYLTLILSPSHEHRCTIILPANQHLVQWRKYPVTTQ